MVRIPIFVSVLSSYFISWFYILNQFITDMDHLLTRDEDYLILHFGLFFFIKIINRNIIVCYISNFTALLSSIIEIKLHSLFLHAVKYFCVNIK